MFGKNPLFTDEDKKKIANTISKAESLTSGEIRVCVVAKAEKDIVQQAIKAFATLGMTKTAERNGVLIMIAESSRRFAIIGDEGIHNQVKQVFWNDMIQILEFNFRQKFFVLGLLEVILKIGLKLSEHFPHADNDTNELSNEVVYLK